MDVDNNGENYEMHQHETANVDDNGSSSYAFEENLTFEEHSGEKEEEETNQTDASNERNVEFIADFTEENANSFPSVIGDDSSIDRVTSREESYQGVQDSTDGDFQMNEEPSTEDTYAQSEDLKVPDQHATDLDAENISEDELPAPTKPKVQDAEEVSDEELPGPKLAELPEDTENVSEEELPSSSQSQQQQGGKKEKRKLQDYDPSDPTDENDAPEKKAKKEEEGKI